MWLNIRCSMRWLTRSSRSTKTSSCQQLMLKKAENAPPSEGEQKAMEMLRTGPQMRHEFVAIVADQVVDKLIECGMIP